MYNYANSVDVYSIWADMVVYDKTYVDLDQRKYFARLCRTQKWKRIIFIHLKKSGNYHDQIVMDEDIPEVIFRGNGRSYGLQGWTQRNKRTNLLTLYRLHGSRREGQICLLYGQRRM